MREGAPRFCLEKNVARQIDFVSLIAAYNGVHNHEEASARTNKLGD